MTSTSNGWSLMKNACLGRTLFLTPALGVLVKCEFDRSVFQDCIFSGEAKQLHE